MKYVPIRNMSSIPTDEIAGLLDSPEFNIVDQLGTYYVTFNVKSGLFEGKTPAQANAMRKAMALLIDRGYIAENIGQTGQQPANAFIPAKMMDGHGGEFKTNDADYTYPDEAAAGYFDPEYSDAAVDEAIALLEEAGYKFTADGMLDASTPIKFEYVTNYTLKNIPMAHPAPTVARMTLVVVGCSSIHVAMVRATFISALYVLFCFIVLPSIILRKTLPSDLCAACRHRHRPCTSRVVP